MAPGVLAGIAGIAGGVSGLVSSGQQASAARRAAGAQETAAQQAIDFQREALEQQQQITAPFRQVGEQAAAVLGEQISQPLTATPGFQFQQQQGEQAIRRSLAGRGALGSGAAVQALGEFNQRLLAAEQQRRDQLISQALGLGRTAAGLGTGAAQQFGTGAAQTALGAGRATAAGVLGSVPQQNFAGALQQATFIPSFISGLNTTGQQQSFGVPTGQQQQQPLGLPAFTNPVLGRTV